LFALPALGQSKPSLVDYPLDVKAPVTDAVLSQMQEDFRVALARQHGVILTTKTNWKASVAALKRSDCEVRDECLRQLAVAAGTLYGIYASVERNALGNELTATGRVVNQDGIQVRAPVRITVTIKAGIPEAAHDALSQLLDKLDLSTLPAVLSQPKAVAVTPDVPLANPTPEAQLNLPPPPPPPGDTGTDGVRIAAWTTGGLAVVAGGLAAGFGVSALSSKGSLPADGHLISDDQARSQQSVNQNASIALGAGIAAGVFAAASIALFTMSGSSSSSTVAVVPTPGGGALTFSGGF